MSSFSTIGSSEDVRLVRWNYRCNDGTGNTGTFLAPSGTTHEQAVDIAGAICASRRSTSTSTSTH